MNNNFVLKKDVDLSIFKRGFAIPVGTQPLISLYLSEGKLKHGEKRTINIILNNENHKVKLTSVNFDKKKYPDHKDMWQIIYSANDSIAKKFREIFAGSHKILLQLQENRQGNKLIKISDEDREYFVLYATDIKDTFYLEPIFNSEISNVKNKQDEVLLENLFDLPTLTDNEASMIEKYRLTKVRKLNRSIGNYLKKLYDFRCQICGQSVGSDYDVNIVECHHINYFVQSLNNDADNLLIVCPNHHRIIHAANPRFDFETKVYYYPNGHYEGLKLNLHL